MKQRPVAIGLLLCEQVIVEEKTGNVTPVNCFSYRTVSSFPSEFPFVVFCVLTDGMGDIAIEVVIHHLANMDEVFQTTMTHRFIGPLDNVRCILRIRNCSFPSAGEYNVSLLADGELVAHRKLTIALKDN
jgi:hypothetical protein